MVKKMVGGAQAPGDGWKARSNQKASNLPTMQPRMTGMPTHMKILIITGRENSPCCDELLIVENFCGENFIARAVCDLKVRQIFQTAKFF